MIQIRLLAASVLILGIAACGDDQVAQQPSEPHSPQASSTQTSPPASDPTAPPPTSTAVAPTAAPPATMTMPPAHATTPREQPPEATGAVGDQNATAQQRYEGRPFTSETISIRLNPGGSFEMTESQHDRRVSGQYSIAGGILTFHNAVGDIGATPFPMRCRLVEAGAGFRLEAVEDSCAPLAGRTFQPGS